MARPHLDRLAAEGMRFTDFYMTSSVCTPSRVALMTGRDPLRAGLTALLWPTDTAGLPAGEITIAEALQPLGQARPRLQKGNPMNRLEFLKVCGATAGASLAGLLPESRLLGRTLAAAEHAETVTLQSWELVEFPKPRSGMVNRDRDVF